MLIPIKCFTLVCKLIRKNVWQAKTSNIFVQNKDLMMVVAFTYQIFN